MIVQKLWRHFFLLYLWNWSQLHPNILYTLAFAVCILKMIFIYILNHVLIFLEKFAVSAIVNPGQAKKCFTVREKDLSKHYQRFFTNRTFSNHYSLILWFSSALTIFATYYIRELRKSKAIDLRFGPLCQLTWGFLKSIMWSPSAILRFSRLATKQFLLYEIVNMLWIEF